MMGRPANLLNTTLDDDRFAIEDIKKAGYELNEESLLNAVKKPKTDSVLLNAIITLWHHGSMRSVPILKSLVGHKNEDVRNTSVLAIARLAGPRETKFFADLLEDSGYRPKIYPMIAIWGVGDGSAIKPVSNYARKLIEDKEKTIDWTNDPLYVIDYMKRHARDRSDIKRMNDLNNMFVKKNRNIKSKLLSLFSKISKNR